MGLCTGPVVRLLILGSPEVVPTQQLASANRGRLVVAFYLIPAYPCAMPSIDVYKGRMETSSFGF
jgi:hypothetical protein